MADLTYLEKRQLEKLFDMGGGYVLNFSDRTFREFIVDAVRRDIDDPKYRYASSSKANRLRKFWEVEANHIVAALTEALVDYATTLQNPDDALVTFARKVVARLQSEAP